MKLLIIEDHPSLGQLLSKRLIGQGFGVDLVEDGKSALSLVCRCEYDLLILDLGLPDIDGISLLRQLRRERGVVSPCLILSARDAVQSRIAGLDAGADDYLVKPFDVDELEARLRALLRRRQTPCQECLQLGNLALYPTSFEVFIADELVHLSKKEFLLLEILLRHVERVVIKDLLEDRLYSYTEDASPNAIEAIVSRMRRKLFNAQADCMVETVRGLGYRLKRLPLQ